MWLAPHPHRTRYANERRTRLAHPQSNAIREREVAAAGTPPIERDMRTRGGRGWPTFIERDARTRRARGWHTLNRMRGGRGWYTLNRRRYANEEAAGGTPSSNPTREREVVSGGNTSTPRRERDEEVVDAPFLSSWSQHTPLPLPHTVTDASSTSLPTTAEVR